MGDAEKDDAGRARQQLTVAAGGNGQERGQQQLKSADDDVEDPAVGRGRGLIAGADVRGQRPALLYAVIGFFHGSDGLVEALQRCRGLRCCGGHRGPDHFQYLHLPPVRCRSLVAAVAENH
jgi:hypothetical protein